MTAQRLTPLLLLSVTTAVGLAQDAKQKPAQKAKRPLWTTSRVIGSPEPPPPYRLERAFPKLKLDKPVYMVPEPGSKRLFAVEYSGKIVAFQDGPSAEATELLHDMKRHVYSIIFHPKYASNGYIYVFSNGGRTEKETSKHNRISRFELTKEPPRRFEPTSEKIILEWASAGHDGGDMAFLPDGCLYITAGDGTSDSDTNNTGQDLSDLNGSILRINVDHPDPGKEYGIPADNPFRKIPGARPELWAFGLRNPWRMSYDAPTGNLWVGNVGQDLWETIHLIHRGDNYGWSVMEGNHPFYLERKLGPAPFVPPIVEHHHTESRSVTGGYVYRGAKLPELVGVYIYCDYETGIVWGFRYENGKVTDHRLLADTTYRIGSFGLDHAGELYLIEHLTGEIYELRKNEAADQTAGFPRKLSETGIFADVVKGEPASGMIEYSVNAPMWMDGASASRLLGLSGESKIRYGDTRGWDFADGTVLCQTIFLGDPSRSGRLTRIETRLLSRQGSEWNGYSYAWNAEQTDAFLVDRDGMERTYVRGSGQSDTQTWRYPSRTECMACHSRAAKYVLGLTTLQMNKTHDYGNFKENQIRVFNELGVFESPLTKDLATLPALANPYDLAEDLTRRGRSYLHANCSHCHVEAGGGNAQMELEFTTEAERAKIFDVKPVHSSFGISNARLIAPGDPFRSIILYRMAKLGSGRMPHLGSRVVDQSAVELLVDWIWQIPPDRLGSPPGTALAKDKRIDSLKTATDPNEIERLIADMLTETSSALALAASLNAGVLSAESGNRAVLKGAAHANPNIRDLFEPFLPEAQRVKRLGTTFDAAALLNTKGDATRGRTLFLETEGITCKTCHKLFDRGEELGPDLSQIGKKYDRAQLLQTIIEPSQKIDPQFTTFAAIMKDGAIHTGILVKRTPEQIVLKTAERKLIELAAGDVEDLVPQRTSLMPDQVLRDLTPQQAADLLEFLTTLK